MDFSNIGSGVIQIVVGVLIGAGGAIVAARFLERRPDLRYTLISSGDIPERPGTVHIPGGGRAIDDIVVVSCTFTNRGNLQVENVPFKWGTRREAKLRSLRPDLPDRVALSPVGSPEDGRIVLLNAGETVTLFWVFDDREDPGLVIEARAAGIVARREGLSNQMEISPTIFTTETTIEIPWRIQNARRSCSPRLRGLKIRDCCEGAGATSTILSCRGWLMATCCVPRMRMRKFLALTPRGRMPRPVFSWY